MTVRKNFTLPDDLARHLEEKAKREGKKQSQIIQELIKEDLERQEIARKLKLIDKLAGMFTGYFPDDVSIQSIKANRNDI